MSRRLRYVPRPMVVEVTCRTVQGRFLLEPTALLNRLAIGVLARAQRAHGVRIHAFCFMSNHYHLLLTVPSALQLARFMNYLQSNLAREAGRLVGWKERFWARRYQAILVSDEAPAQLARLRYILAQGCKEGIVRRPEDWSGAHCVRQLMNDELTLKGQWIDRTALYRDTAARRSRDIAKFTKEETLALSPLPCFEASGSPRQSEWIRSCVEEIAAEARRSRPVRGSETGQPKRGRRQIEATQPMKRTSAPWFHVASSTSGRELRAAYALFLATYRSAAQRLKKGLEATFPAGSFPPASPFVSA